jgi:A/G-specific adenine glycosylase
MTSKEVKEFRRIVWTYYKKNGRNELPWRNTKDPYRVLVSEVMLQQTQVPRVIEKYKEFLKKFPTVRVLAKAPLSDVLKVWSGLGYNRRGKYLHDAAKKVVVEFNGNLKKALEHPLPGVGPYTRAAVRAFAFNEPGEIVETNVRTAYTHHFFKTRTRRVLVSDSEISLIAHKAAAGQDPREWHWALMDYGSYLKKSGVHNNVRSAHYTKQSKFEGSLREVRGQILRDLIQGKKGRKGKKWEKAFAGLARDGLIVKEKGKWRIP